MKWKLEIVTLLDLKFNLLSPAGIEMSSNSRKKEEESDEKEEEEEEEDEEEGGREEGGGIPLLRMWEDNARLNSIQTDWKTAPQGCYHLFWWIKPAKTVSFCFFFEVSSYTLIPTSAFLYEMTVVYIMLGLVRSIV